MAQRIVDLSFESRGEPLISRWLFVGRMAASIGVASLLIGVSLVGGMWGYHHFENMSWVDAFVNAAMILSGMGPLGTLNTTGGKIFAGCYALYSGLTVIIAMGLILAPVFHRVIHRFHLESEDN